MHAERLRSFLDSHHIPYSITRHCTAHRAREVASAEHLPAWEVAKTIVILGDEKYHLVVIPADRHIDLHELKSAVGFRRVRLATETELGELFRDCELGAVPPIGMLYGLPVYLDSDLANEPMISFSAGTHHECMHMRMSDFRKLTFPTVVSLARVQTAGQG